MIKRLLLLLALPLLLSCVTQERVAKPELIAHAGGEIDGYVYTNSLEALCSAAEKGYRYIELDLIMTSDSVLVAAHSWADFNSMTGNAHFGDSAVSLDFFKAQRIHGRYTPLTAEMINEFFMENERLYLVTDKISSPAVLESYFPELKGRMVVEAFSYEHYRELLRKGYFRVLYSCMAEDMASAFMKNLLFDRIFPGERIEWVALHTSGFNHSIFKLLNSTRRFNVALFTVDNYNEILPEYRNRAKMIYTNTILPEQLLNP